MQHYGSVSWQSLAALGRKANVRGIQVRGMLELAANVPNSGVSLAVRLR